MNLYEWKAVSEVINEGLDFKELYDAGWELYWGALRRPLDKEHNDNVESRPD